jgi:hypothetical protein
MLSCIIYKYYFNDTNRSFNDFIDDDNNNELEENFNGYFNLKTDVPLGFDIEKLVCSKNCCSTQWPTSISTQIIDPKINIDDYLPTNLNCNDGIRDTGCVCKKK